MARNKKTSDKKQQFGQFMTPSELSKRIVSDIDFKITDRILEPCIGDGSFIIPLIHKFIPLYTQPTIQEKIDKILTDNLFGYEIDPILIDKCIENIEKIFNVKVKKHNFKCLDFFTLKDRDLFDYVIGNPPFGGTFQVDEKELDKTYGFRLNEKIKKETYSFFIIKCYEEFLKEYGSLIFISSNTILTLFTLKGLRKYLSLSGKIEIETLSAFSKETNYGVIILNIQKGVKESYLLYDTLPIEFGALLNTPNFAWYLPEELSKYFGQKTIGNYMIGSGGLTTGKNELFLRKIQQGNTIMETHSFEWYEEPITLEKELWRARFNEIPSKRKKEIEEKEQKGETQRSIKIELKTPEIIQLPNEKYAYYNKSDGELLYSFPEYVIYWENNGDAVKTYKKNNRWHLQGVGGEDFYGKEGITWQLICEKIRARFLPEGYILDNSAPILILKEKVHSDELFFILAWLLSDLATKILKTVINHTKNIQAKDLERLPYPFWVEDSDKEKVVKYTREIIDEILNGVDVDKDKYLDMINKIFI